MRIQFCGADRTVTGSCHLIEVNGLRILLDCGMYQGHRETAARINGWLPNDPARFDAVILSHGHLDHCGKLPVLLRAGYQGPVYCTPATHGVARIVLTDAAEIQQENADYLNRRGRAPGDEPVAALYTVADIPPLLRLFKHVPYGQRHDLGRGVAFTFYDAGHILGSAYIMLEWNEGGAARKLCFTADVGRYDTPILRDPHPLPGPVDVLITESTYGNARHAPIGQVGPDILDAVNFAIANRSRLLVPAFAVGRTQTMLWYLQKFIAEKAMPQIPIFVDSPMGVQVTHVHDDHPGEYDEQTTAMAGDRELFNAAGVTFAVTGEESRKINHTAGPCVIIASSPTCEFGRILHHLKFSVEREKDLVLFTGFIPHGTLGRRLQEGQKRVRILDRWYDVRCQTRTVHGLSAHADSEELLRFLKPTLTPQTTAYVVHGEEPQSETFAAKLLAAGVGRANVPAMESSAVMFAPPPITDVSPSTIKGEM